jgi:glutamate carboxypeptidase
VKTHIFKPFCLTVFGVPIVEIERLTVLIKKAQAIYKTIPIARFQTLGVAGSGGGTDRNYANFAGTSTLDALGLVGGGSHTLNEYIELDRIPARIYLLTKLIMDLGSSR